MPRPKTKSELIELSNLNFNHLMDYYKEPSDDHHSKAFPTECLNRNTRDVLGHLYEWHLLFFNWYNIGMAGERPPMPAEGYTWKTTSDLNRSIQKKHKSTPLTEMLQLLRKSHKKIMKIVSSHSNEELFTKKKYKWTGSTSLGAYLVSSTSSHYDWALKLIKKALK